MHKILQVNEYLVNGHGVVAPRVCLLHMKPGNKKYGVDASGVITTSRGCFERCCSNKKSPPYTHSNLSFVTLRNRRPTLLHASAYRTPSEASPRRRCGHASRVLWISSVFVFFSIYMCIHTCVHAHVHVQTCIHAYHISEYLHLYLLMYLYKNLEVNIFISISISVCMYIYLSIHLYIHTYIYR